MPRDTRRISLSLVFADRRMESVPPAEVRLVCAECGRQPRDDENAADEWRANAGVDRAIAWASRRYVTATRPLVASAARLPNQARKS